MLVVHKQRAREHVAQKQDDAEHLVRLDTARDDPLGQVARVGLERLDAARLEGIDVVVVDGSDLGEDLLRRHHAKQLGVGDPPDPFLSQLRPVLPQVVDELMQ